MQKVSLESFGNESLQCLPRVPITSGDEHKTEKTILTAVGCKNSVPQWLNYKYNNKHMP